MSDNFLCLNGYMENFIIGGFAGVVSRTVSAPLDRLKILRQNNLHDSHYFRPGAFRYIVRREGFRGLFKGNLTSCIRIFPQGAIQYGVYRKVYSNLPIENEFAKQIVSGAIAGATSYTGTYPIELVRVRLSMQDGTFKSIYRGFRHGLTRLLLRERRLFPGWRTTMLGIAPQMAINFTVYETLKRRYGDIFPEHTCRSLVLGSISGITAMTSIYPAEIWRRRLQLVDFYPGYPQYRSLPHLIGKMYRDEGMRAFYKGYRAAVMRIGLANGVYFSVIDILRRT